LRIWQSRPATRGARPRASRQRRRAATANACSSSRSHTSWQIADPRHNVGAGGEARKAAARQFVLLVRQAVCRRPAAAPRAARTRTIRFAVPISTCTVKKVGLELDCRARAALSTACRLCCCAQQVAADRRCCCSPTPSAASLL
jgi:hypothetical protein